MTRARLTALVAIVAWAGLISPIPRSLHGAGIVVVIVLVGLDVILGQMTGWLAFARPARLDEREAALRDRAYRSAFRLIWAGMFIMGLASFVGLVSRYTAGSPPPSLPIPDLGARTIVAFLEMLVILPTLVIAWVQPKDAASENVEHLGTRATRWIGPALAIPVIASLWLLAVAVLPARAATISQVPSRSFASSDVSCGEFSASREVGYGFGASVRLRALVCWDGRQAWVYGDSTLPRPTSQPSERFGVSYPYLTSCAIDAGAADFGVVADQRCTETFDAAGTMHYAVTGRVSPGLGGLGSRDLRLDLTVTRDGHIVEFG